MKSIRKELFKGRFNDYYPLLCKIALKYISNHEECEDIVQETFIAVWNKSKDDLPEKEFISYMVMAVKNNCISFLRKNKHETVYMEEMLPSSLSMESNEEEIEQHGAPPPQEQLAELLAILPAKCREVFIMSKLRRLKYREIGEILNISEKTVENHMGKAIKLLKMHVQSDKFVLMFLVILSILIIF
jgi:RNA polymerase sigma-70 factor (family 1)